MPLIWVLVSHDGSQTTRALLIISPSLGPRLAHHVRSDRRVEGPRLSNRPQHSPAQRDRPLVKRAGTVYALGNSPLKSESIIWQDGGDGKNKIASGRWLRTQTIKAEPEMIATAVPPKIRKSLSR